MSFRNFSLHFYIFFPIFFGFFMFSMTSSVYGVSPSSISIDVSPSNPAPYEEVTITLSSYAANLDSVGINWSIDGKTKASGIGKKSFMLKAGGTGTENRVTVTISLPDGVIEKNITIRPSVMTLLWQATDSYVPPFYKGKAMPILESEIKIVAMPEVTNSKNMTYSWKLDYTNDQTASGYGKNFYLYSNDYLEATNNVGVVASTIDQKYSSEANIDVGTSESKILFYKNDPTFGTVFEKELTSPYRIIGKETVVAIPYFISPKQIYNPRLIWNWSINDNTVGVLSFKPNEMPLQVQAGTFGTSRLKVTIENMDRIFQTSSKELSIEF